MSIYDNRLPTSYAEATLTLGGQMAQTIPNVRGTLLIDHGDRIVLAYHGDVIATFHKSGVIVLDDSGECRGDRQARLNAVTKDSPFTFNSRYETGVILRDSAVVAFTKDAVMVAQESPLHGRRTWHVVTRGEAESLVEFESAAFA